MLWTIAIGLLSLLLGVLFLTSSEILQNIGKILNKAIFYIDEKLYSFRIIIGLLLIVVAGWIISVAFSYPGLWSFNLIGGFILFFGLLYLFFPHWLAWLSKVSDQTVFSIDEMSLGYRKVTGIIFIIAAIYLFYSACLAY